MIKTTVLRMELLVQQLSLLNQISALCRAQNSVTEIISQTTSLIARAYDVEQCGFMFVNRDRGVLVVHDSYTHSGEETPMTDRPVVSGITGRTIRTGVASCVVDVKSDPDYIEFDRRTRSQLCLPLRADGEVVGVLNLEDSQLCRFSDDDVQLLNLALDLVSTAIERARANDENTLHKNSVSVFHGSSRSLNSLVAATPHWIYIFDLDAMGITYSNRSLLLDLGHPPGSEEAERSIVSFADYMPQSEWPHLASLPDKWRQMKDGQFREDEYRLNHIDGRTCSFACREVVYAHRPDGSVKQILGTLTDITERKKAEQDLVRSERRFRDLADAIPQIVWTADADGGLSTLNAKATEYTGVAAENLTGWSWDKVIHPDDLLETVAVWNKCLSDGQPRDVAFRIRRADHTYRWHITRQVPVSDASGKIVAWYGTCTDVEDLKRTEASLQESESRFRLLMEGAADAIFWADAETGILTNCNHAAEILLGRDRDEIIGQPQSFLHPPEEAARYRDLFQEHVQKRTAQPVELQVIRKDGTRVDVAVSPSVTFIRGQHVIQGIFRDVSARKLAEDKIRKLSDFRETIIRTAGEGICVCFPVADFPFVEFSVWNDRMTEITGYTMAEINRLGWYQALYPDPEIQSRAIQRMDRMRTGDDLQAEEWEIVCRDGARRTVAISTSVIELEGNVWAVAALIQDISIQKQALSALKDKEQSLMLFRELVNWTNDTIHVIDPVTSRFLDVNERACERLGYSRSELLNLGVVDIEASLTDLVSWQRHVRDVVAAGSMLLEGIHCRKDGTTFPVEVNVRHVTVDHKEYLVAIARDISDRRYAEAAQRRVVKDLRSSEERFSKLFHASPFSIIVASYPGGRIVEANEAFLRLFEFTLEEVIGRTTSDLDIWESPGERQRMLESLENQHAARNMEYRFRTKSGRALSLVMSVELIQLDGLTYSLAMSIDITGRKAAEAELQKTDELLRAVVKCTTDAVFVKDFEGKYLLVNDAASQFVGMPVSCIIGQTDSALFDETAVRQIQQHDRAVMASGVASTNEDTATAAGISRTYLTTRAPYRDAAGNVIGLIGIARDISDRKREEQATRDSERLLTLLMDSIPAFTAYVDSGERYRWVNKVHEQWFGRTREEIIGKSIGDLHGPEAYALMKGPVHRALQGENVHYEQDISSAGHTRTFDVHYVPHRNRDGHVLGFFALVFELTRERSAQLALRESELRYRSLFETCGDAIFILDLEGRIRSANPAAARMHGYHIHELAGMNMRELDVPADADLVPDRMKRLLSGETLHFEVMHRHKDGTEFPLDVVATLLQTEEEPLILAFDRDIRDRKRDEEHRRMLSDQLAQAQKMEAIGRLAGGVAHDFNNILTVINGYSRLLQELSPSDKEWSHMLFEISEAGARAASLTQQLLNYSRKQVIDRRVLDVNDIIHRMENMLRQLIGEDIRLMVTYHEKPAMVKADAGQIGQVVMNLAVNARDAMPHGGLLAIAVSVVEPAPELLNAFPGTVRGKFVQLSVRDNGVGIPHELQDRIFEPFFTTKGTGMGTGLGLASVRSIAEDGQGFVCVASHPNQGSDFRFHLPLINAELPISVTRSPGTAGGRATILLVEDEHAVRAVMRRFLEHYGYSVLDAASAAEAMSVAEQAAGALDLLITDVVMPETGGRELVEQIRSRWPTMKYLYVSGYSTDDVVRRGVMHSNVAFLQKPFSPEALASKVREVLANAKFQGPQQDS